MGYRLYGTKCILNLNHLTHSMAYNDKITWFRVNEKKKKKKNY